MHHFKNDDPLCAVFEELCQFALQLGFGFMLGYDLQVVPGCLALPLQLNQVVRQLLEVHLEEKKNQNMSGKPKQKSRPYEIDILYIIYRVFVEKFGCHTTRPTLADRVMAEISE